MLLSSIPQQQQQQQQHRHHTAAYVYHHHHRSHNSNSEASSNTLTSSPPSKYNKLALQRYRQERLDSMSITVEEYQDVLNAEVWIEVNKLRDYARHGISKEVRGVSLYFFVWNEHRVYVVCVRMSLYTHGVELWARVLCRMV